MSGCCLAGRWCRAVPAPAFIVVSLVLARHWAGGSLNDGSVIEDYRFKLIEQF
jgi:hypothetical protein